MVIVPRLHYFGSKGAQMKFLAQIYLFLWSPVLALVYWKNSLKVLDDIHASFNVEVE